MESSARSGPSQSADNPTVSRFVCHRRGYNAETQRVKAREFEPARLDHATSVFVIDDLVERDIWDLGDRYVAPTRGTPVARGDISRADVRSTGLQLVVDNAPPRHAAITAWPPDKHECMSKAQQLAAVATLRVREQITSA
jgi:hypothetical protein